MMMGPREDGQGQRGKRKVDHLARLAGPIPRSHRARKRALACCAGYVRQCLDMALQVVSQRARLQVDLRAAPWDGQTGARASGSLGLAARESILDMKGKSHARVGNGAVEADPSRFGAALADRLSSVTLVHENSMSPSTWLRFSRWVLLALIRLSLHVLHAVLLLIGPIAVPRYGICEDLALTESLAPPNLAQLPNKPSAFRAAGFCQKVMRYSVLRTVKSSAIWIGQPRCAS